MNGYEKARIIQETVPGKQITICHIIANPDESLYGKLELEPNMECSKSAIGIVTMTPSEGVIIAADLALKSSGASLGFVDRFSGTLVITGAVSEVEASLEVVQRYFDEKLGFAPCDITKT